MNMQTNTTNVRINEPYFIFGLTNLQVYKICVFVITSRTRDFLVHPVHINFHCRKQISKVAWN